MKTKLFICNANFALPVLAADLSGFDFIECLSAELIEPLHNIFDKLICISFATQAMQRLHCAQPW